MPRGDQTGPTGQGPRTGRGAGYCSGNAVPGFANPPTSNGMGGFGRGGRGLGRGGGRGWRNMFFATGQTGRHQATTPPPGPEPSAAVPEPATEEQESAILQAQAKEAAAALEQIRQRIDEYVAAKTQDATNE